MALPTQKELSLQSVVSAGGTATVTIDARAPVWWTLTQISVEVDPVTAAPAGARGVLRKNGNYVSDFITTGDAIGGDPPLVLRPGETASLTWTGCTPGAVAKAFVIYDQAVPEGSAAPIARTI